MAVMTKFLANMPQKSRAYYTKAGTRYKVKDTRNGGFVQVPLKPGS
jgi:hypothetical protein